MKKSTLSIIVIALVGLIMLVTCPKENDHKETICLAINEAVDEKVGDSGFSLEGLIKYGAKYTIKEAAELFIDSNVEVQSYGLVSIGRYTFNGHNDIISVGMFNHVFTMSKEDILREVEKRGL